MSKQGIEILTTAADRKQVETCVAALPGGWWQLVLLAWQVMVTIGASWPAALKIINDVIAALKQQPFDINNLVAVLGADAPALWAIVLAIASALGVTIPSTPPVILP